MKLLSEIYNNNRRSGNTTRLLDETVQTLFTEKECYVVFGHSSELSRFEKLLNTRFLMEHGAASTVISDDANWSNKTNIYRLVYERINTTKHSLRGRSAEVDNTMIDLDKELEPTTYLILIKLQTQQEYYEKYPKTGLVTNVADLGRTNKTK